jgi:hypothetical protein
MFLDSCEFLLCSKFLLGLDNQCVKRVLLNRKYSRNASTDALVCGEKFVCLTLNTIRWLLRLVGYMEI